jgi:hypothetical protein
MRPALAILAVACASTDPPDATEPVTDTVVADVPSTDPVEPLDDAVLTSLSEGIEAFAERLVQLDLAPVQQLTDGFDAWTDPTCPAADDPTLGMGAHADCTTRDGTRIWGAYRFLTEDPNLVLAHHLDTLFLPFLAQLDASGDAVFDEAEGIYGDFSMTRPDGSLLQLSGEYFEALLTAGDVRVHALGLYGPVQDADAADSWLADGVSCEIGVAWFEHPGGSARAWHGGLTGLTDAWPGTFTTGTLLDLSCPTDPRGAFGMRNAVGTWFDVDFGDDCDGCAEVSQNGTVLGTVCPDLTPLTTAIPMELP